MLDDLIRALSDCCGNASRAWLIARYMGEHSTETAASEVVKKLSAIVADLKATRHDPKTEGK